jgi:hypothetical protein
VSERKSGTDLLDGMVLIGYAVLISNFLADFSQDRIEARLRAEFQQPPSEPTLSAKLN